MELANGSEQCLARHINSSLSRVSASKSMSIPGVALCFSICLYGNCAYA